MFWQRTRRRRMEELIRSAKTDFPVSQEYTERVAAAIEEAAAPTVPGTRDRRDRTWVVAGGGVGVLVLAVALFLLFRPSPGQAALRRVLAAAEAVNTYHIVYWIQQPESPRETFAAWYGDGEWRLERWHDDELIETMVYDGEKLDTYDARTNALHLNVSDQPFGTPFEGFTVAAMLKTEADSDVAVTQTRDTAGRPLNRFEITKARLEERIVVLADPLTDLPMGVEFYGRVGSEWQRMGGTDQIEYNITVDPHLFVLAPPEGAAVVDNAELSTEWQQRYDSGMHRVTVDGREAILRDFQVTTTGDVFAIWSWNPKARRIQQASLSDSLGTVYMQDTQGHGYFQAWSSPCAWFVPLESPIVQPAWYVLTIGAPAERVQFRIGNPVFSPGPDPVYPAFKDRPGAAVFIRPWGPYAEIERAEMRACYWKERGNPRRALLYFQQMVRISDREVHRYYVNAATWLDIGALYEQLGMTAKAKEAYKRGIDSYDRDPNRRFEKEPGDSLRAAISRLR